jgi:hypothetical protein
MTKEERVKLLEILCERVLAEKRCRGDYTDTSWVLDYLSHYQADEILIAKVLGVDDVLSTDK